jgi:acyl dehydratase
MTGRLYFEDLQVGMTMITKGRTITESDIVNFAGLSGDFNPLHTDAEYAAKTEFGQRIAHGALGLSIATGLANQLGFMEGTVIAFTALDWKYRAPIFIGDTIHVEITVNQSKAMPASGGGFVIFGVKVVKQDDTVTQEGKWTLVVRSRPETADPA